MSRKTAILVCSEIEKPRKYSQNGIGVVRPFAGKECFSPSFSLCEPDAENLGQRDNFPVDAISACRYN